jgi:hypothetical protein
MRVFGGLLFAAGGLLLVFGLPDSINPDPPEPIASDVLAQAYATDRAGRVATLHEMADTEFNSDAEAAEWHNEQMAALRERAFAPYIDRLSSALVAGTVAELADELE